MDLILICFAVVAAFALVGMAEVGRQRLKAHGPHRLAWRWLTGMPHHGKPLTDAGWNRPGMKAYSQTEHVRRWWYLPRRVRAVHRTVSTFFVLAVAWGLLCAPGVMLPILAIAAAAAVAYGCWRAVHWVQMYKHYRTWVGPAHLVAAPLVGIPVAADPGSWLEVAPDRSLVVAQLPPGWNGDGVAKARLVSTLTGKLGIEAPEVRWQLAGPKPRLEIMQSAPLPPMVTLADMMPAIEAAKPDELVWGPGKKDTVVKSSLSGDSPHIGLSMGSGAGKSETAKSLLAQQLHRGAIGLILDYKMTSHPWAKGLPNVVTAVRMPEIHKSLIWLAAEVGRRKEVAYAGTDMHGNVHADVGPRVIVVLEELNATVAMLRSYWRETGEKGRSPALTALDEVSFTGRSVLMNLVYIGQRLSDKATGGGGDARENIGVIAFARYRPSTWKMLAPDFPMPPKTLHPGRLHVVSDAVREAQGILMTTAEARELATSGTVSPLPYGMPGAGRATADTPRRDIAVHALELRKTTVSAASETGPVTLREAVEAGLLPGLNLAGARTARHRDPAFPAHVGRAGLAEMYDPQALARYGEARNN